MNNINSITTRSDITVFPEVLMPGRFRGRIADLQAKGKRVFFCQFDGSQEAMYNCPACNSREQLPVCGTQHPNIWWSCASCFQPGVFIDTSWKLEDSQ